MRVDDGPNGELWFTTSGVPIVGVSSNPSLDQLGEISPTGVVTMIPLPAYCSAGAMAVGPDGAMWVLLENYSLSPSFWVGTADAYTGPYPPSPPTLVINPVNNFGTASILRVDPSGVSTDFPLPSITSDVSFSGSLISGPGGDLWFSNGEVIDRITTAGAVTQFTPFTADASASLGAGSLAAGADGDIWFSDGPDLGRMTPEGAVTLFPVGAPGTSIYGLITGPDGDVWFLGAFSAFGSAFATDVGKISDGGAASLYALPSGLNAVSLASGAGNDDVWFVADHFPNAGITPIPTVLGRITTAGAITFQPSVADQPSFGVLTFGPGGNLWFTSNDEGPAVGEAVFSTPEVTRVTQRVARRLRGADVDLAFESDLDRATAENVNNYVIERLAVRRHGIVVTRKLAPTSAEYDAATDTVVLHVKTRLVSGPRSPYVVVIDGALASPEGERLTGVEAAGPESNAVVKIPRATRAER